MELRERIKQEFDSRPMERTEVAEWGEEGAPLAVYAKPLTLAELSQIQKYAGSDEVLLSVYTVIFKALDADGQRLFKLADKHLLLNGANPAAVGRLANWILQARTAAQAAEK
jgi:hypothetical protein